MRSRLPLRATLLAAQVTVGFALAMPAGAQTNIFSYQGKLEDSDPTPPPAAYEFEFRLYDDLTPGAPDLQIGPTRTFAGAAAIPVTDSLFTAALDFGDVFPAAGQVYLDIRVRRPGAVAYTPLTPRQHLTIAPFSGIAGRTRGLILPLIAAGSPFAPGGSSLAIINTSFSGSGVSGQGPVWGVVGASGDYPSWWPNSVPVGVHGVGEGTGVGGSSYAGAGVEGLSQIGTAGLFEIRWNAAVVHDTSATRALVATNQGFGAGAVVELSHSANTNDALDVSTAGSGRAGLFERTATTGTTPTLLVTNASTSGNAFAVHGLISPTSPGGFSTAVRGENRGTAGSGIGVHGTQNGSGWGVLGVAPSGIGVYGSSSTGTGVRGESTSGLAGQFGGNVTISGNLNVGGTLTKGAGAFMIDHPLDPTNKYLVHSFVESPDMKNMYDGAVVLDETGGATITLPDYFQALNGDFRYQLTCIGGYAPVYIAEEVRDNRFVIAGGTPGLKVSWQVTGTRHDAFARANRLKNEVEKPDGEKGSLLHPTAHE